jgi:GT2 family glycosyltransferase
MTASVETISVTFGVADSLDRMRSSLARSLRDGSVAADVSSVIVTQPDSSGLVESVDRLASWERVIAVDENLGFAAANKMAVTSSSSEYVAFLNPDLELTEGWLPPLLAALDDPAVAIAAPVLLHPEGHIDEAGQVVFSDGGSIAIGGRGWPGGRDSYPSVMFDRDVDYASAACWVMRRSVFDELGGFATDFWPAYFEDNDLAQRARRAGYVTRLITARPVIHHHEGASAERVAIADRSRSVYERIWGDELTRKPDRSLLDTDVRAVRDWHCATTTVDHVTAEQVPAFAARAASDPRNRYTAVLTDGTNPWLLQKRYRPSGLEILSSRSA